MKEIQKIVEDLESIFSIVNANSKEAAITLMSVIQKLERIRDNVTVTPDDLLEMLKKNPEHFLTELMWAVGPQGVFRALSNMLGFSDDISILSKSVPPLNSYSLERLRQYEEELKRETDPMSRYLLKSVQKHIIRRTRREGKTE